LELASRLDAFSGYLIPGGGSLPKAWWLLWAGKQTWVHPSGASVSTPGVPSSVLKGQTSSSNLSLRPQRAGIRGTRKLGLQRNGFLGNPRLRLPVLIGGNRPLTPLGPCFPRPPGMRMRPDIRGCQNLPRRNVRLLGEIRPVYPRRTFYPLSDGPFHSEPPGSL